MSAKESDFDKLPPTNPPGQPPLDDSWAERVPQDFGNYTRIAELGKGGFGIVYHVRHRSLGFDRALKVLDPRIAAEPGEKQRFLREARVLADLHHVPQVVHIHEVSTEADPWNWLLMELITGLPLAENYHAVSAAHCLEWHRQTSATGEGRLPEAMVLRIFKDVLAALRAAHGKGVIHRDVKPGNILLMPDGSAKLADFGLVKLVDGKTGAEEKHRISTKHLPNSNRYMGTTAYMSPEQQDGLPLDARSDIYSLGLVIYELLVGHRPGLRMKLPHQMGLPVAAWWDDLLDRMLETRPADRPGSAAEVVAMLSVRVNEAAAAERAAAEAVARQAEAARKAEAARRASEEAARQAAATRKAEAARIEVERERIRQEEIARKSEASRRRVGDNASSAQEAVAERAAAMPNASPRKKATPLPWILAACVVLGLVAWGVVSSNKPAATRTATVPDKVACAVRSISTTKDQPFVNSLGMKFVPIGISTDKKPVLFSIWETRVKDYAAYAAANSGVDTSWNNPGFTQTDAHPVTCVSWEDADKFCKWITEKERASGKIGRQDTYHLPTDVEWSYAVGIGEREDASKTPKEKHGEIADVYPWGTQWPPPKGAGNYCGQETKGQVAPMIDGYDDGYATTAPVGSFKGQDRNPFGICDLGGNAWEWCESSYDGSSAASASRVLRGGSWCFGGRDALLSSCRGHGGPGGRGSSRGFRCVLVVSGS
jgi:tRNA A-37 threonylcarbamoyl transferase component Bud32